MKAVFVIDVDKDELGEAVATITAEENGITFFARGVIKPMPQKISKGNIFMSAIERDTGNACIDEILGETE